MEKALIDTDIWAASSAGVGVANVRHYARVVEVGYLLRVENWREEG